MNVMHTRGVPFPSKMVYKRVRDWTSGQSLPIQNSFDYPPEGFSCVYPPENAGLLTRVNDVGQFFLVNIAF